ncbi:MAG TPA: chemotaxis protein CheW [Spirochaetota bacterium]|nr:chemotaxis protein CheW [Spirochaetota bacterium]HPJ16003.1 chemotaxis protein CheW [Spirochaetota bacterium]HQQ24056.1 chemotaxis protein CheW [Spirochaetota bacterium]
MTIDDKKDGAQYLTFLLDSKLFAFDVLKTREVLSIVDITPIPGTPDYMTGVLNLRGSVVPVIDLRKKFGLRETAYTENTSIVIVEAASGSELVIVGALVDAVRGVRRFEENQLEPPPKVGMKLNLDLIYAIGKTEKDFVLILNVDKVLSDEDISLTKDLLDTAGNDSKGQEN